MQSSLHAHDFGFEFSLRQLVPSLALSCLLALAFPLGAKAEVVQVGPDDDLLAALNGLSPGDELVLADGMYTLSQRYGVNLMGSADAPIVVRAAEGATPHVNRPNANQNIWDINAEYAEIRGIEFSGGSAGLRFQHAIALTLEGCHIHHTQDVAIRMNDGGQTYEGVRILRNHVHDTSGTGEGMYLGCNNDGCRLANAVIVGNYVHHTDGGGVSQGDGIELKEGSHDCLIADNVIHNTRYPCILTYGAAGNGGINRIERNLLWACGDHGIQTAADALIENNVILGAAQSGIGIQPHQSSVPGNLTIVHNTVINPGGDALSLRGAAGAVVVANNAFYSRDGSSINIPGGIQAGTTVVANIGEGGLRGLSEGWTQGALATDFVAASYSGVLAQDVFPSAGSALTGAGDMGHQSAVDFNGIARAGGVDVGAYEFGEGSNPGWTLAEGPKPESGTVIVPDADAGVGVDAGPTAVADAAVSRDGGNGGADAGASCVGAECEALSGGCGCRVGAASGRPEGGFLWVLGALAWSVRRQTRRQRRRS